MKRTLQYLTVAFGACLSIAGNAEHETQSQTHFNNTYDSVKGKVITPSTAPIVNEGVNLFISADFIYWYSSLDKASSVSNYTAYDVSSSQSPYGSSSDLNTETSRNTAKHPSSMDPGFKVAAGMTFDYDGWDSLLEYTWIHPKDSKIGSGSDFSVDSYIFGRSFFGSHDNHSTAYKDSWFIHFNNFNWELGRSFFVSPKLVMRPHMGFRATWQKQGLTTTLGGSTLTIYDDSDGGVTSTSIGIESTKNIQTQRYWGFGIRSGLNLNWLLSRNWSLLGNFAITPLWGHLKSKDTIRFSNVTSGGGIFGQYDSLSSATSFTNENYAIHHINMVYDFMMGVRWDCYFSDDAYRLTIQAAWEEQLWSNFFLDASDRKFYSNTYQGLSFKVRFDF